ncbi:MAG TPA: prepilin-type N-terminal cleavage/methylation domain-containing protein [Candidatus Paceibacterota bacterium]|nr:prepilin-type N-terminal cleavage/methylation domain-containing protein [Candidatus Paceibacterota bacterium]
MKRQLSSTTHHTSYLSIGAAGFSLIELLVVVAIITLVSAVVFANINKFGGQSRLQSLVYDIALTIRQAQVYGISVKQVAGSNFDTGFGVSFNLANPALYRLFNDINENGKYDAGEDVSPSPYAINQNYVYSKLCATISGTEYCPYTSMNIVFIRPNPNAYFIVQGGGVGITDSCTSVYGNVEQCSGTISQGRIVITSPRGDCMSIIVSANGEISVAADPACT